MCKDNNDYRNNYERCSQLIDETILNVLVAHKTRSIDANSEIIMSKITEIYDVLSENVENINSAAKYLLKRDTKIVQNSIKGDRYTPHL